MKRQFHFLQGPFRVPGRQICVSQPVDKGKLARDYRFADDNAPFGPFQVAVEAGPHWDIKRQKPLLGHSQIQLRTLRVLAVQKEPCRAVSLEAKTGPASGRDRGDQRPDPEDIHCSDQIIGQNRESVASALTVSMWRSSVAGSRPSARDVAPGCLQDGKETGGEFRIVMMFNRVSVPICAKLPPLLRVHRAKCRYCVGDIIGAS